MALRRLYAPRQARRAFPAWPAEDVLLRLRDDQLRTAIDAAGGPVPLVGYWPSPHRWAFVLTHDVEGVEGIERIPEVLELERRYGVVSSWNLCGDWYPIPDGTFELLRGAGCEVGLHGIAHDGLLFSTRERFEANLPRIRELAQAWGVDGFRSPATGRKAEWMHELPTLYDSSFPDTDPFEPQGGGCCSILPFRFGDVIELPITLVQDHTMWEILRRDDIRLWTDKATWLAERHGLVNVIVHPDYLGVPRHLEMYEELLAFLCQQRDGWHALPRDVARWWRAREGLGVERTGPRSAGLTGDRTGDARGAAVWWAANEGGSIVIGPEADGAAA